MSSQTHQVNKTKSDMEKLTLQPLKVELTAKEQELWEKTLTAGIIAQRIVGDGIAVGGTAATLYAGHRLSFDTDHLLMDLKGHFDEVLDKLSDSPESRCDYRLAA
jgi:hypothetical protein